MASKPTDITVISIYSTSESNYHFYLLELRYFDLLNRPVLCWRIDSHLGSRITSKTEYTNYQDAISNWSKLTLGE